MTRWILCGLVAVLLSSVTALPARAQGTDVGITGSGLISIQPADTTYVGGPYLNAGLGGTTMGVGASVTAIATNGVVAGAEYSTARLDVEQYGRLVNGSGVNEGQQRTSHLRDSLLLGVIGRVAGSGRVRTQFVAGAGIAFSSIEREGDADRRSQSNRPAFMGGADVLIAASPRVGITLGGHYTFVARDDGAIYWGISKHVIRATAGLRIRLN